MPIISARFLRFIVLALGIGSLSLIFQQVDVKTEANPIHPTQTISWLIPPSSLNVKDSEVYRQQRLKQNRSQYPQVTGDFYQAVEVITNPDVLDVFVNKNFQLPATYQPNHLVYPNLPTAQGPLNESILLQEEAAHQAEKMFKAAKDEGLHLIAKSGYRSYQTQAQVYQTYVRNYGIDYANQVSAKPGHSEHQTGLALDITTKAMNYKLNQTFAYTTEGQWLAQHAPQYGFILRYPEGRESETGYVYEPWHFRYVGTELAQWLTENEWLLEEYVLVYHYL